MIGKHSARLALGVLMLGTCVGASAASPRQVASAMLQTGDGSPAGTVTLIAKGSRLELHIAAKGLPAGEHGAHLHMVGRCEAPGFASAGGHLNPFGKMHGMLNSQGHHLGDLPNLAIGPDGTGSLIVKLDGKRGQIEPLLFDSDGTAIVVHAAADDLRTDPSGNSGPRLACGILLKAG